MRIFFVLWLGLVRSAGVRESTCDDQNEAPSLLMKSLTLGSGLKLRVPKSKVPKPHSGQVLIEVHDASILNIDTYSTYGVPLGHEASGLVVQSGGGKLADSLLHKRVARLVRITTAGAWADYLIAPAEECVVLSDNLSYADGATMTNAMTLGIAMHLISPRTSVVMTVPLSGLGRLASAWLKLKGMHCIRIVHKQEYVEKLHRETDEPVLYSGSPDFVQRLRSLCRQHNVTAAFEMVGGTLSEQIFAALQPGAVHVQIGFMEAWSVPRSEKDKRAELLMLLEWVERHPAKAATILREVSSVLPTLTASDPLRIFSVSNCSEALSFYLSNRSKTRVQIQFRA